MSPQRLLVAPAAAVPCGATTWQSLPDEAWLEVLQHLPVWDVAAVGRVCRRFRVLSADPSLWRTVSATRRTLSRAALVEMGSRRPLRLRLDRCRGMDAAALSVVLGRASGNVRDVALRGCDGVDDDAVAVLARLCPSLTALDLSWCRVTDAGAATLAGTNAPPLASLRLQGCSEVTDAGVGRIAARHGASLRLLDLFGCYRVTDTGVGAIADACTSLQALRLVQCASVSSGALCRVAAKLLRLRKVDLSGCKLVDDAFLATLGSRCPELSDVSVEYCILVTDAGVQGLANATRGLRTLNLNGCVSITDAAVRDVVVHAVRLERLGLSSTDITAKSALLASRYCPQLQKLQISYCSGLEAKHVRMLADKCPQLVEVSIFGCGGISEASVWRIKRRHPRISFFR